MILFYWGLIVFYGCFFVDFGDFLTCMRFPGESHSAITFVTCKSEKLTLCLFFGHFQRRERGCGQMVPDKHD